jgi:DNA-binding protein HU-beta
MKYQKCKNCKEFTMNKKELIEAVANRTDVTKKEAAMFVDAVVGSIADEIVEGGKVALVGFGTFECVKRNERKCRNLQTGEEMTVAAKMAPKFRPSKSLKDAVAGLDVEDDVEVAVAAE